MQTISTKRWILFSVLWMLISAFTVAQAQTVYITKTGEKYHKDHCQYLQQSKITIAKSDAISKGYTACSKCNPGSSTSGSSGGGVERLNQGSAGGTFQPVAARQCTGITQAGQRCKNPTKSSSGRCHHHD